MSAPVSLGYPDLIRLTMETGVVSLPGPWMSRQLRCLLLSAFLFLLHSTGMITTATALEAGVVNVSGMTPKLTRLTRSKPLLG